MALLKCYLFYDRRVGVGCNEAGDVEQLFGGPYGSVYWFTQERYLE